MRSPEQAIVAARSPASIGQSRAANPRKSGPASNCHIFVTNDGTISRDAAATGGMIEPSMAMETVGNPIPITPLTMPARNRVLAMAAIYSGEAPVMRGM